MQNSLSSLLPNQETLGHSSFTQTLGLSSFIHPLKNLSKTSIAMAGQEIVKSAQASALSIRLLEGILFNIFNAPPPLPIRGYPFQFLVKVDLTTVSLRVEDMPQVFGRSLVVVEVGAEQFHVHDTNRNLGLEFEWSGSDFPFEKDEFLVERDERTGERTGLEALETPEEKASEEVSPEKTLAEEFPKKRRFKVPAGRTDLPLSRPFKRARTQRSKPSQAKKSKSSEKTTVSPPPRSTRKSIRLALPLSAKKPRKGISETPIPEKVEEITSSPDEPLPEPENTPQEQGSPLVPEEAADEPKNTTQEQGSSSVPEKTKPKPSTKPVLKSSTPTRSSKRKTSSKLTLISGTAEDSSSESAGDSTPSPPTKRAKKAPSSMPNPTLAKFLKRHVVRGKIFKVAYFQNQGLEAFIEKVRAQGWLELFTNTHLRCSPPELAEFYSNCSVKKGVVTSHVGGKQIEFDAEKLGSILGVPCTGFDVYVREDKTVLEESRLLNLARSLSQDPSLEAPRPIKKGEMTPLNQLLYWFVLKNVIPRGQGRNNVDLMAQCLIDLLVREEKINLPALMIKHIERIANPSREHDLGYGFLLTLVFDFFEVKLTKPVGVTFVDEVGSGTLLACGFTLGGNRDQEQGPRTPSTPVSAGSSISSTVDNLVQAHAMLVAEVCTIKSELDAERAETITRYETLLALLRELTSQLPPPPPPAP